MRVDPGISACAHAEVQSIAIGWGAFDQRAVLPWITVPATFSPGSVKTQARYDASLST
jgi:hypothetical protein